MEDAGGRREDGRGTGRKNDVWQVVPLGQTRHTAMKIAVEKAGRASNSAGRHFGRQLGPPRHSLKRTAERLALQLNPAQRDCDSISEFMSRRFQSMAVPVRAAVTSPASVPPTGRTGSCRYACRSPYRNKRCFCCCTD